MNDTNQSQTHPVPNDTPDVKYPTTNDASGHSPDNLDEQDALGGSASHPEADSDIDDMYQRAFGTMPDQTDEIPNLADEINNAEQAVHDN